MNALISFVLQSIGDDALCELAGGNKNALEAIYREYGKLIYSIAFAILKSREDSEDVLQDVMLKIVRSAHRYRKGTSPKAWIASVARSCAMDHLQKNKDKLSLDDESVPIPFTEDNYDFILLREALETLSDEDNLLIRLRYYAGLDLKEIATVLCISHSAARKRCSRALETLGKYFQERKDDQ